jgi:hypothetical protein
MIVECKRCGAPLDVSEGKRHTKCAYCGATSETRALRTVAPQTPGGWQPPRQWTPPSHTGFRANAPLTYHAPKAAGVIVLAAILGGIGVAVAAGAVAFVSTRKVSPAGYVTGLSGVDPARLATVTLRERREDLAKALGATGLRDNTLRVPLASREWSAVTFEWDPAHPEHVLKFHLNCDTPHAPYAAVRARLEQLLPKRWDGEHWRWEDVSLYYGPKSGVLSVNVSEEQSGSRKNPFWKQQSEAMWSIVLSAALGLPSKVDAGAVRAYLGGGYPITELSKVDFNADVDGSGAAVARVFPGAEGEKRIDLDYTVALNHPWLEQAELSWGNAKGAKLKTVELRKSGGKGLEHQDEIAKCVEGGFGAKPKVNESDYLAKNRDYTFRLKEGGEIRVYGHLVKIELRDYPFAGPMPKATFDKAMAVLDACGRK